MTWLWTPIYERHIATCPRCKLGDMGDYYDLRYLCPMALRLLVLTERDPEETQNWNPGGG
jgi:hypothetical protein